MIIDRLRLLLQYDPDSGIFRWRVARGCAPAGSRAGCQKEAGGYRVIRIDGLIYYEHRLAWIYAHGKWPDGEIDHLNNRKSDNRLENLREATSSQNQMNAKSAPNVTGVRGVYKTKYGRYAARIKVDRKIVFLGTFLTAGDAESARNQAAAKLHGIFAHGQSVVA